MSPPAELPRRVRRRPSASRSPRDRVTAVVARRGRRRLGSSARYAVEAAAAAASSTPALNALNVHDAARAVGGAALRARQARRRGRGASRW